ncbi:MAG: prepilin-type N-terminal cleavage/methylation domain-containing protein [Proteobacteria bacterium]|nr:prepilin-type N-terminal cleavage/methylation domain-containing protein [Pseudomonadota bacterium]
MRNLPNIMRKWCEGLLPAKHGFSLLEVVVGSAILVAAASMGYESIRSNEKFDSKVNVHHMMRTILQLNLENASINSSHFLPLTEKIDTSSTFPVYYVCGNYTRKGFTKTGEVKDSDKLKMLITENADGEVDIGITDGGFDGVGGDCKTEFGKMYKDAQAPLISLSCLKKAKIGLRFTSPKHDCGKNNVVSFILPLKKQPKVVAWSFKLNENFDIEEAIMQSIVVARGSR